MSKARDSVEDLKTLDANLAAKLPKAGGTMTGDTLHGDNVKAKFGTGNDLEIYHDGSNSYVRDIGTGNLLITTDGGEIRMLTNNVNEFGLRIVQDDYVGLYHNNAAKLHTTSTGIDVTGNVDLPDNGKLLLGAGDDLQIYHDGTNSHIADNGTGNLILNGNEVRILSDDTSEYSGRFITNGAVELYYDSAKKLSTTATGIDVTGTVTADGLGVSGNSSPNVSVTSTGGSVTLWSGADDAAGYVGTQSNHPLVLRTNQTERMRIDTSGRVGFGNSSPITKLHISGSVNNDRILIESPHSVGLVETGLEMRRSTTVAGAKIQTVRHPTLGGLGLDFYTTANGSAEDSGTYSKRVSIDSSGNVGIGVVPDMLRTSDTALALGGTDRQFVTSSNHYVNQNNAKLDASGNPLRIIAAAATRYQMLSTGVHTFDVTGSGAAGSAISWNNAMTIDNSGIMQVYHPSGASSGSDYIVFRYGGTNIGSITQSGTTSTSYNTSSDYRLKTDVQPMTGATATFKQLKPVNFEWIADGTRVDGFLAHELQEVIPAAATGTKDGMMDEEYEVSPATGDVYTAGSDAGFNEVSSAIEASPAYYDVDGNVIKAEVVAVAAVHEAFDSVDEVIHSSDVAQPETLEDGQAWRETTEQIMATRSVPDMQGIDQAKVVPLLVATIQELIARVEALEVVG